MASLVVCMKQSDLKGQIIIFEKVDFVSGLAKHVLVYRNLSFITIFDLIKQTVMLLEHRKMT